MAAAVMPDRPYEDEIPRGHSRSRRDIMLAVCSSIGDGTLVKQAAQAEGITPKAIWEWALASQELGDLYARAREKQAHALAEQTIELSDEAAETSEQVARQRLRVDTRKWYVSKIAPKLYGDKTHTEVAITASVLHLDALKATAAVQAQALQNAEVARISVNAVPQLQAPQEDTKVGSDIED